MSCICGGADHGPGCGVPVPSTSGYILAVTGVGAPGSKGEKGDPGEPGTPGAPGADSTVPGPAGPVGPAGAASTVPGPVGPAGATGPVGPAGSTGSKGDKGDVGATGSAGSQGNVGAPGAQGIPGPVGATGSAGGVGPQGEIGKTGPAGPAGAASTVPGPAGPVGATGPKGDTGAASTVPGPAGPVGATGPAGPASTVPGPAGATGPAGPAGAASTVPGPVGPPGADSTVPGPVGPPGADSTVPGPAGPTGPAGAASTVPGPVGPAGAAATVAVGTTTTGAAGSAATVTNTGTTSAAVFNFTVPQGVAGIQGVPGVQGPAGLGIQFKGEVPTFADLPTTGQVQGDLWTVASPLPAHGWAWDATTSSWVDAGQIQGPQGIQGPASTAPGPQGPAGPTVVSADAGNTSVLGTDGKIFTPGGTGPAYTLPVATASVLGGVKVGTGLSVDGTGVLSATVATGFLPLTGGTMTGTITAPTTVPALTFGTSGYNVFGASGGVAVRSNTTNITTFTGASVTCGVQLVTANTATAVRFGSAGPSLGVAAGVIQSSSVIDAAAAPTAANHLTNKAYVDAQVASAGSSVTNPVAGSSAGLTLWTGSQSAYDSIATKDPKTVYMVV